MDIDVHLRRENRSRTIDKVAQRIRLNRTKLKSMQDTSTDYEELTNSIQAGYFIKNGIANYNEDLFYMSVFITVSAKRAASSFQQEVDAVPENLWRKGAAQCADHGIQLYIFTSFELSDDNGVLLGINRYNNSLCIVDLFNTKINKMPT